MADKMKFDAEGYALIIKRHKGGTRYEAKLMQAHNHYDVARTFCDTKWGARRWARQQKKYHIEESQGKHPWIQLEF